MKHSIKRKLSPQKLEEINSFKAMPLREKLEHIWYYYKVRILVVLLVAAGVWVVGGQFLSVKSVKIYAKISYYDCPYDENQAQTLLSVLAASGLYDTQTHEIVSQDFLYPTDNTLLNNSTSRKFFAEVAAQALDILIVDLHAFPEMTQYCMDLSGYDLPEELLLYDLDGVPKGARLTSNPLFNTTANDYALLIFVNSRRAGNAINAARFILGHDAAAVLPVLSLGFVKVTPK